MIPPDLHHPSLVAVRILGLMVTKVRIRANACRDTQQQAALTQFRADLTSANLIPADTAAHAQQIGYDRFDDQTLLRFLRARKFDLAKAKLMWETNEKWRKEFGTDDIAAWVISSSCGRQKLTRIYSLLPPSAVVSPLCATFGHTRP